MLKVQIRQVVPAVGAGGQSPRLRPHYPPFPASRIRPNGRVIPSGPWLMLTASRLIPPKGMICRLPAPVNQLQVSKSVKMANFSFDIVSEYDKAEMNNVFDQVQ